jgi:hypothetical protein
MCNGCHGSCYALPRSTPHPLAVPNSALHPLEIVVSQTSVHTVPLCPHSLVTSLHPFSFYFDTLFRRTTSDSSQSSIIGFCILIASDSPKISYLGTFFGAAGIYSNVSQTVAWNGNNIGGSTKRSVGIAMQVGFGNLGGVLSGYTYTEKDRPKYRRGHGILIGLLTMSTVLCVFMRFWCARENKGRDEVERQNGTHGTWDRRAKMAESEKGDNAAFFRYTL